MKEEKKNNRTDNHYIGGGGTGGFLSIVLTAKISPCWEHQLSIPPGRKTIKRKMKDNTLWV